MTAFFPLPHRARHGGQPSLSPFTRMSRKLAACRVYRSEDGMALGITLMFMVLLSLLGATYFNVAATEARATGDRRHHIEARLAAENAIQRMVNDFRTTPDTDGNGIFTDAPVPGNVDASGIHYNDIDGNGVNDFDQVFLQGLPIGSQASPITFNAGTPTQASVWVEANTPGAGQAIVHAVGASVNSSHTVTMEAGIGMFLSSILDSAITNAP